MPLRKRLSLAAAVAVAMAVAAALIACYLVVRGQLLGQIDGELRSQASAIQSGDYHSLDQRLPGLAASAGGPAPYVQFVLADGTAYPGDGGVALPDTKRAAAVAAAAAPAYLADVTVHGTHLREYTFPAGFPYGGEPVAIQLARPLAPAEHVLERLRLILSLIFLAGVALAAVLGRFAARRVLRPLAEVSDTARTIGETDDLKLRLAVRADDEVGELASRFNEMLERLDASRAALDESVRSQRQLVADASHELRTPVTSLRTNIEVLLASDHLDPEERRRLLADVVEQSEELTTLVSDLIEVARGDLPDDSRDEIRLDRVVEECVGRARRNAPTVTFRQQLSPVLVRGNAERLSRAINNLLDNAAAHTSPHGPVEVTVDGDGVRVRDHGSGIAQTDLPYVFDRFYRGASSRSRQGSGLGLSIVRQVAQSHGGTVEAGNAEDGGAVFTLRLPTLPLDGHAGEGDEDGAYGAGGLVTRA